MSEPDASLTTKGITYLDTAPAVATDPKAVGANNVVFLAVQQSVYLDEYASMSAARYAIGTSVDTELIITGTANITANLTMTKNYRLKFQGEGKLNISTGVTLTIDNGFGLDAPLDKQIFTGSGNVYFPDSLPKDISLEWFGAVGDGSTSDNPAFDKFIVSYPPSKGAHLVFAGGKTYYFANSLEFDASVLAESSGSEATGAAILKFGTNKTGIIVHHQDTKTGSDTGRASFNSVFKNLRLLGNNGSGTVTNTHTVSVSGTTVTKTAGAAFSLTGGYVEGNTITISGFTYVIASRTSDTVIEIKPSKLLVSVANGSPYVYASPFFNMPVGGEWNGKTVNINGVNYTITATAPDGNTFKMTLSTNYSGTTGADQVATVNGLAALTGLSARPNIYHGFDLREHCRVEGCYISGFAGNAIGIDNTSSPGNPNTNYCLIQRNVATENYGSGIFTRGVNANQINFINNDLSVNVGYGIWEHGFLGNRYFGNHTSFNRLGSTDCTDGGVNDSIFIGEYSESGQLPAFYGQNNIIFGGTHGAGFAAYNAGSYISAAHGTLRSTSLQVAQGIGFTTTGKTNTKAWMAGFGTGNFPNAIFEFGAGEELANTYQGNPATFADYAAFKLLYNRMGAGIYSLHYKENSLDGDGTVLMTLSGSASNNGGRLGFPTGFIYTPRIKTEVSQATVTLDADTTDQLNITAQATGLTLNNPTGTAREGQTVRIRIKDNGTARAITYGSAFRAIGVTLPTTTVANKTLYLEIILNNTDGKWDVIDVKAQA